MTDEQVTAARRLLPSTVPVVKLTVGVDCAFYAAPTSLADLSDAERPRVEKLLQSSYAILLGDELRLNEDALTIVQNCSLNIARVCQFGDRKGAVQFKSEIERRGLQDRLVVFERISYASLRFLLRHACAYAGLVDSSWQPAGWTVACESLASGLPIVLYEGLVSRELQRLGAGPDIMCTVPPRDTHRFAAALKTFSEELGSG